MKVAFQAGVLQVWLDEAELHFDAADGASGGVFNLAMWCQGMSGTQMADNWRRYHPLAGIEPDVGQWMRFPFSASLFKLDRFRRNILGGWGLDWPAIRATEREATFNLYDFSSLELQVVAPAEMDEDRLISAVTLPTWFPPVVIDGSTYIDAVYATDANLEEAIRRGADELWVIWTVSRRGQWRPGLVAHYFQTIEAAANSQLRSILGRIERNNASVGAGAAGEFGRHVEVKLLQAEVPLHYLVNLSNDRVVMAVEQGVATARRWCAEQHIPLKPPAAPTPGAARPAVGISFREQMHGFVTFGAADFQPGYDDGARAGTALGFHLDIAIDDFDRFLTDPTLAADATGWVDGDAVGGRRRVERGRFNLFVDEADPARKHMLYELWFTDRDGAHATLLGYKTVAPNRAVAPWAATTTLYTRVVRGHTTFDDPDSEPCATGILRLSPSQFVRQLSTFRTEAPAGVARSRRAAIGVRFARLFVGELWDVYVSPSRAPVAIEVPT